MLYRPRSRYLGTRLLPPRLCGARPNIQTSAWHKHRTPKPPWFAEGSKFTEDLELSLNERSQRVTFYPFAWSGANSVHGRFQAAKALAEMLDALSENCSPIVI